MKLEELFDPYSPPETNFLDRLRYWAAAIPEKIAYRFIAGDGEIKTLTFAELDQQAKAVASSAGFAEPVVPVNAVAACASDDSSLRF